MSKVTALVLRRMRAPLLALIAAYSVAILGFVLIPGVDADGNPHRLDFFHAFYFVSYMATTIGFGELPYPFTTAQRLWTTSAIYMSVVAWLYAIGSTLALVQNPALKRAVSEGMFARRVRRGVEPFYIICGYGDTGALLAGALARLRRGAVVIDSNEQRIDDLALEEFPMAIPALCADASEKTNLVAAGLLNPRCAGVVALTNDDQVNLSIAIACKLLNPSLKVICRADAHDTEANMRSFGTDHVINPFDAFAKQLAMALHSPAIYLVHDWLTSVPGTGLGRYLEPRRGRWVLCGFGRFGRAMHRFLSREGVETMVVEVNPELTGGLEAFVSGRGTEAATLREAGIKESVGVVAGTDNDANNLSVIVTAKELNPALFTVARQNRLSSRELFEAADIDVVMQRSDIIAHRMLALIVTPLLAAFLGIVQHRSNDWANELVSRIAAVIGDVIPEVWSIAIDRRDAPAVAQALASGARVSLRNLCRDPRERDDALPCIPLMIKRGGETEVLPDDGLMLKAGDQILFCGREPSRRRQNWCLVNRNVLDYVKSGYIGPHGVVWRRLTGR